MKIRTSSDLVDRLNDELAWRKTDLLRQRQVILSYKATPLIHQTLLRSAIPILYAHWEGFVKESSLLFFNFIALRKLPFSNLKRGLLSAYLMEVLIEKQKSDFENGIAIVEFFEANYESRSELKAIPNPVKTKSNLNSEVLREIVELFELDYEKFRGFENLIDSKLLALRNKIAHGEYRKIEYELYDELYFACLTLINLFNTEIQNCVVLEQYKR